VSLFGAVFNHQLQAGLTARLGAAGSKFTSGGGRVDPATLKQLPPPVRTGFLESLASAISHVFAWAIVFAVALPLLALFIQEIPLRGRDSDAPTPKDAAGIAAQDAQENTALAGLE
jgi:hypothetical protein